RGAGPRAPRGQTVDSEAGEPGEPESAVTGAHTPGPDDAPARRGATTDFRPDAQPGAIIAGRYTLVERLGEGGMGEVWVAKQTEPVKRKVALKLIKAGMGSKAVVGSFEHERHGRAPGEPP